MFVNAETVNCLETQPTNQHQKGMRMRLELLAPLRLLAKRCHLNALEAATAVLVNQPNRIDNLVRLIRL